MVQNQQQQQPQAVAEVNAEQPKRQMANEEGAGGAVTQIQHQQQQMNNNKNNNKNGTIMAAGGRGGEGAVSATPPTMTRTTTTNSSTTMTEKVGLYELYQIIGKGNYATVKLARHKITKTEVAIKIVDKSRLDSANLAKIYREIDVLKKLRHPNIVRLYQVIETHDKLFLVTEYAPNGEIYDLISKQKKLSEEIARQKFWQIISAVDYLHSLNIVHRDLKAEHLLLDLNFQIKLADFGFSNFFSYDSTLDTFCGSMPYAAPEVFEGKPYTGPEIDIWSLGVILYVMVCGVLPFDGFNLQLLRDRVLSGRIRIPFFMSCDCEHLVRRMLTVDSRRRATIEQIKHHRWMRYDEFAQKYELNEQMRHAVTEEHFAEPHPQIVRLMKPFGFKLDEIKNAIQTDAYGNLHAFYLLLLERLRGHPLSRSHSASDHAHQLTNSPSATSLPLPTVQQTQAVLANPTTGPAVVLTESGGEDNGIERPIIRGITVRRQSDGIAFVGGAVPCHCYCCSAARAHPMLRAIQPQFAPLSIMTHFAQHQQTRRDSDGIALQFAYQMQQQKQQQQEELTQGINNMHQQQQQNGGTTQQQQTNNGIGGHAAMAQQKQQHNGNQNGIMHHQFTTSDYESENCFSGSSAAGSTLSRQSTIGTISSFDDSILDDAACTPSCSHSAGGCPGGLLLFNGAALPPLQHHTMGDTAFCGVDQLPSFDSQLSQDPLFSSQSSNKSATAFCPLSGSRSANSNENGIWYGAAPTAIVGPAGGSSNVLFQQNTQPHPQLLCNHYANLHHGVHPHLLQPYQQQQQQNALFFLQSPASARTQGMAGEQSAGEGDGAVQHQHQHQNNNFGPQHHLGTMCDNVWRASDNAIGDPSVPFPTGQLGKRNRAVHEIHRPSVSAGVAPLLHSQLRKMRISTSASKTVPMACGVSVPSTPNATTGCQQNSSDPTEKRSGGVGTVLGMPKRISLPENLEFQPQMLLNLKQSIHVEKQLTSNSDTSDSASEIGTYEKPVLKASRLQHYQHQQQQKRKAVRLQLLRQQSYQLATKQSMLSYNQQQQLSLNSPGGNGTIPAQFSQTFHQGIQLQPLKIEAQTMEETASEVELKSPSSAGDRVPLSPIEDMKIEEVMDTS